MRLTRSPEDSRDRGSAAVEFVLVGTLVVFIGLALVQLVLAVHVRNTLTSCAHEGARVAARADASMEDGLARAEEMAADALGGLDVEVTASTTVVDGVEVAVVTLRAPVPLVGLWGPRVMEVDGRAFEEGAHG